MKTPDLLHQTQMDYSDSVQSLIAQNSSMKTGMFGLAGVILFLVAFAAKQNNEITELKSKIKRDSLAVQSYVHILTR